MAESPQKLFREEQGHHRVTGIFTGKAGHILSKVVETGEPFFVLRAKDIFTPMIIREYLRLIEQYAPEDYEFQESLMEILDEIRKWQKEHVGEVRYPD